MQWSAPHTIASANFSHTTKFHKSTLWVNILVVDIKEGYFDIKGYLIKNSFDSVDTEGIAHYEFIQIVVYRELVFQSGSVRWIWKSY